MLGGYKTSRWLTCCMALALLAAANASAQVKLTLGYTGAAAFTPAFVAKAQGYFEQHGLDVTLQPIPLGPTMPAALVSQSLHVATLTAPVLLLAKEGGLDLGVAAAASYQSRARTTAGAVARADLNIQSAANFKGRKVGVPG